MKVLVIGGTGHIGSYLVPRLVEAGHDVTSVSRGRREPYRPHPVWGRVTHVELDRTAEEEAGEFGRRIGALGQHVVIDLTCYTLDSAQQLVDGLRGTVEHLIHCGTIWVHGHGLEVPTTEDQQRAPFGEYGCRKAAIEEYLLHQARAHGVPVTLLHPGHLVGQGWAPINPAANFNTGVFSDLANGREVCLPGLGLETVHHVHTDDVAQAFVRAIARRNACLGESVHVVSPAALTLRGYAEAMARWFGREASLRLLPWDEWRETVSEKDAGVTLDHLRHSSSCSIEKARSLLGYQPRYRSLDAVQDSVTWLLQNGVIRQD
jgi:nucleoside-diphosphate-sugar epimerase